MSTWTVAELNAAEPGDVDGVLRPCLDVDRWVAEVVAARPYVDRVALLDAARAAADPLTDAEVEGALAHHPRIGDRPAGASTEESMSRAEQAGLGLDAGGDVTARLAAGNRAYEQRFGRVFLIRAAGRSSEEILAALEERMGFDPATELDVVRHQLREIALLRLEGRLAP